MSDSEKQEEVELVEKEEKPVEEKTEEKITNPEPKKEKDPKRVAQGKRLAQISKAAKEKKMREKIAEESQLFDISVNYSMLGYILTPVAVFAGMYLYFSQKQSTPVNHRGTQNEPKLVDLDATPKPKKSPPPKINHKKNVVSLFD